jgi:hypothetical protein
MKTACAFVFLLLLGVGSVGAQSLPEGRFRTGSFSWTPTLTLRDAGVDTNVFDEARDPKQDTIAVVAPAVQGHLETGLWTVKLAGNAEFVYFRRYTNERSINGHGSVRAEVGLSRFRPFVVVDALDTRERQNSEIDLRARRAQREFGGGTRIEAFSRTAFELSATRATVDFREGELFRGEDVAQRLNRSSTTVGGRMLVRLTPLTTFAVEGDAMRDEFTFRPDQNTDNLRFNAGFEFAPDAVIHGRAKVGIHEMTPNGTTAIGYRGLTAAFDIGYLLLGRTSFTGRISRDTAYSLEEQPYFLQTRYGVDVTHNLIGAFDLLGHYTHETLDYPGIPQRNLLDHLDEIARYGGGVAIRPSERTRVAFNYEFARRTSGESADLSFDRRRLYTTVTFGF